MRRLFSFQLFVSLFYCFLLQSAELPTLKILTVRYFARGLGEEIKQEFEKQYDCKVEYCYFNDVQHLLTQIKKAKNPGDLVVGVAYEQMQHSDLQEHFIPHGLASSSLASNVRAWRDDLFFPYEYGVLSFVYDSQKIPHGIHSFSELLEINERVILIDPRTSMPGLGLLLWVKQVYGEQTEAFWKQLSKKVLTVARSWSPAYALFLQKEAPVVLSYLSSPAAQRMKEGEHAIKAAVFEEGHYVQYSVSGILKSTLQPELARAFMHYLLEEEVQKKVVALDFCHPVVEGLQLPEEFEVTANYLPPISMKWIGENRAAWMEEWKMALQ